MQHAHFEQGAMGGDDAQGLQFEKNEAQRVNTDLYRAASALRKFEERLRSFEQAKSLCDQMLAEPKVSDKDKKDLMERREAIEKDIDRTRAHIAESREVMEALQANISDEKYLREAFGGGSAAPRAAAPEDLVWPNESEEHKEELPN